MLLAINCHHHHHHHHHHLFAFVKENDLITSQGNGEETTGNHVHRAYERGHLDCH